MKTVKQLREDRGLVDGEILTLRNKYEDSSENKMTEEDAKAFDEAIERAEALNLEIEKAEKREAAVLEASKRTGTPTNFSVQDLNTEDKKASANFDFMKAVRELANGKVLTGLEKELVQEGIAEAREAGIESGGNRIVVPSRFMEKRTDIDQATSAIAPTFLGDYTDALRETTVYNTLPGVNTYQLTGDFKLPVTAAQSLAWATENSAAADGGANFTSDTLTPFRLAGYVDISNEISVQNGPAATQAIMRDLGRAEGALINTAMFNATTVTNAPTSLPATSGVLTFTEATPFADKVSVFSDVVKAEQTIADNHGLNGNLAYVYAGDMLSQIKQSVLVAGLQPGMGMMTYNDYQTNNYTARFTNGATTATGLFGDWSRLHVGRFGGLSILVDPYSVAGNNQTRLVVNSNVDWSLVQGAAFVKWTSLLA